jgi:NAD(P)-dependent dehydrogenase (short-subunit alcohol dehydrogenase family)
MERHLLSEGFRAHGRANVQGVSMSSATTQQRTRATATAKKGREIQKQTDARERGKPAKKTSSGAVQAGSHDYPAPPFPEQHHAKPGLESQIEPRPQYKAEGYLGSAKLADRVAIITGGDSGIGRAVAVLFAREGADVAIVYLDSHEDAEDTRAAVLEEGGRCLLIPGDVTDPRFCEEAVEATLEEYGKLDILVNNAAYQEHAQSIDELSEEHFELTVKTNLFGYYHMAKAAVPHLTQGSAIINTGSETGIFGSPNLLDYSATKGAIHAFSKSLASNLVRQGIRVNVVAPGPVWTPLNPADGPAEKVKTFGSKTDMKRPAQPEEIAPAYVFLAAPCCSSYITGIVLPIMGGVTGSA